MAKNKDLYEILGVSRDASDADIKNAYRKLAKQYHPDLHTGKTAAEKKEIEEKFKEINNAYSVLSDPQKKSNYDNFGSEDGMGAGGFQWSTSGEGGIFEDILSGVFGGGFGGGFGNRRNANQPMRGEDITTYLTITFQEAIYGCQKSVEITRDVKCSDCKGTGAANGTAMKTCSTCGGKGYTIAQQMSIFGQTQVQRTCSSCGGTGKIVTEKCKTCKGKGFVKIKTNINVKVPAGIDHNQVLTYRGEGQPGINGGPSGDVNIVVNVINETLFQRDGYDLRIQVPITPIDAMLGASVKFNILDGKTLTFDVPKSTQTGTVFRMKGKGIKYLRKEAYGDLYVQIVIETPKSLTSEQKSILQEFNKTLKNSQIPVITKFRGKQNGVE